MLLRRFFCDDGRAFSRAGGAESERFCIGAKFSFAHQKRTRKVPATFEAREARIKGCSPLSDPEGVVEVEKC